MYKNKVLVFPSCHLLRITKKPQQAGRVIQLIQQMAPVDGGRFAAFTYTWVGHHDWRWQRTEARPQQVLNK